MHLIGKEIAPNFPLQAIQRAVSAACVIFTGAALFGLTGLLGRWLPIFDVAAQMAPVFLAAGALGLALALCERSARRKRRRLLTAIATAGCGLMVAPEAASRIAAAPSLTLRNPSAPPRVVEINLRRLNADPGGSAAALRAMRPYVLLMSEPTLKAWALYKSLRSQYPSRSDRFRRAGCEPGILSRPPLDEAGLLWPAAGGPAGRGPGDAYARSFFVRSVVGRRVSAVLNSE